MGGGGGGRGGGVELPIQYVLFNIIFSTQSLSDAIKDLPSTIKVDNNLNINETIFTLTLVHVINNDIVHDKFLVRDDTQPVKNFYFTTTSTERFYQFMYISEYLISPFDICNT